MGTDKEGCVCVFTLSDNCYYLTICLIHSTLIFCPGTYSGLEKQREFLPPSSSFFFPRGGGLINVTMLSGPAEYIYLVLGEWWPQKQECA